MIAIRAALLLAALALVGCVGSAPAVRSEQYTLVPPQTTPAAEAEPSVTAEGPVLRIAEVQAPLWLNSTRMYYRLDYRTDAEIAAYSQSEWVAPPPILLAGVLQNALAGMARWKAVVGAGVAADADVTLRITLNDFQQVFSSREESVGVLDVTATLFGNALIAQRRFHIVAPAPSPDAQGGVEALSQASRELGQRVRDWVAEVAEQ